MYIRVALCQINSLVGDIEGNTKKIVEFSKKAKESGAKIICFPELALCGYPPEDLVFNTKFIKEQKEALEAIKEISDDVVIIVGFVDLEEDIYNSAAILCNRKIYKYKKIHLPNYGVFDEMRYFSSGKEKLILQTQDNVKIGISICEDIWHPTEPLFSLTIEGGAEIIVNISASPYHISKPKMREDMMKTRAADYSSYILFCNLVGGQDELVFDGTSSVISPWGETEARAPLFKEYILIKDIDITQVYLKRVHDPRRRTEKPSSDSKLKIINLDLSITQKNGETNSAIYDFPKWEEEVFFALVTGTRDYILKNRFSKALIALSGGIDSSLTACIATEAIGPENVIGISMPSQFSSHHSVEDAEILSKNLGIKFLKIPIMRIYDAFMNELSELFGGTPFSSAEENLQARIRGNIIMTISNKFGHIVLACGNKSEMSVGYATLYGDLAGGFAVIKDLYKTDVYKIAKFYNEMKGKEIIPKRVFEKPPSAELRPNQKDEDDLPPYKILDAILKLYIEKDTPPEIIEKVVGADKQTIKRVIEMVEKAEYKRRQAPPGIKISSRAFGKDRRMPITKKIDCILKF